MFHIKRNIKCRIIEKLKLELVCFMEDHAPLRILGCTTCFEMFPPSFYIRYTKEEIKTIVEEEKAKLLEYLDTL